MGSHLYNADINNNTKDISRTNYIEAGHVADILREEFMEPLSLYMNALARAESSGYACRTARSPRR